MQPGLSIFFINGSQGCLLDEEKKEFKLEDIIEHIGVPGQPVLFWSDTIHCGRKYRTEESEPDESEPEESEGVPEDESELRIKRRKTEASGASRSNSSAEYTSTVSKMQWTKLSRLGSKS